MAMKNHKKTYRWIFLAVFVVALLFLLATLLYGVYLYYYSKINYQAAQEETFVIQPKEDEIRVDTEPQTTAFVPDEDWEYSSETVRNILLIGVDNDNREGMQSRGNADGLILLSINEKTKQVILTSLMRDIDVLLPEGYHTKITLSYYFRGIPGLIEVVERNFNVPIDNYVLVNYLNLIDIVDARKDRKSKHTDRSAGGQQSDFADMCGRANAQRNTDGRLSAHTLCGQWRF